MVRIINSGIYYLHFKTLVKIFWHNVFIDFYWKRALITSFFYLILFVIGIINILFRIIDEFLFIGYRKTRITKPIFIISAPRSGTSLLLSLLATDDTKMVTLRNYHFIINSIVFYKIVLFIERIERPIGSPLKKIFRKLGRRMFRGWDGIHPTSFESVEEDEGFWFFSFVSPAWALLVPNFTPFRYLNILDNWPESEKKHIRAAYFSFLKRFYRANGRGSTLVIKSVMSSGRVEIIKEMFPDVRIITIHRELDKTLPSYISMFSRPWPSFTKEITIKQYQSIGQSAIDFYEYLESKPKNDWLELDYQVFITDTLKCVEAVYQYCDLDWNPIIQERIAAGIEKRRKYVSGHKYSMEGYGYERN